MCVRNISYWMITVALVFNDHVVVFKGGTEEEAQMSLSGSSV